MALLGDAGREGERSLPEGPLYTLCSCSWLRMTAGGHWVSADVLILHLPFVVNSHHIFLNFLLIFVSFHIMHPSPAHPPSSHVCPPALQPDPQNTHKQSNSSEA